MIHTAFLTPGYFRSVHPRTSWPPLPHARVERGGADVGVLLVGGAEALLLPPRHLLAQLGIAGDDHVDDQHEEAQRYAGLGQHTVFDLCRVAQPGVLAVVLTERIIIRLEASRAGSTGLVSSPSSAALRSRGRGYSC